MGNRIKELFGRYESGQASREEIKLVEDWFRKFNNEQQGNLSEEKKATIFDIMDGEIHRLFPAYQKKNWISSRWLQVAALFLVASGLVLFKIYRSDHFPSPLIYTRISAPNGTKKKLTLSDGTLVFLNSGSSIQIPSNFGDKDRRIELSGEVYFQIKHNPLKPFTIHTDKLIISDIGTSFNVKAYPNEKQISIAVESGIVSIEENNFNSKPDTFAKSVTTSQQFIYDKQTQRHTINNASASEIAIWKQNKLRFDNTSFDEIAHTLERWYNIPVKLDDDGRQNRLYTISFNNEPLSKVLKVLRDLSGMSYRIDNNTLFIHLKNRKRS